MKSIGTLKCRVIGGRQARPPKPTEEDETFQEVSGNFLRSRTWRAFRLAYLAERPICDKCKIGKAHVVHHTTPRRELPIEEWYNTAHLQPLCDSCHSRDKDDKWREKRR